LKPAPYANYYPLSIGGCALWLDAADPLGTGTPPANGATLSTWSDKSGNNVILNTVGTPTYNSTQYGKGGVIFNGSSYFQNTTFSFPLATRAIFIVANGSSGNTGILAMTYTAVDYSSLNSLVYVTSGNKVVTLTEYYPAGFNVSFTSPVEPFITSDSANGTTVSFFGNGTLVQSLTFTPTRSTGIIIGARNDAGGVWVNKLMTGNINEIILYRTTLTTNQRQQVEGYLAWKWGIQSSFTSHPYSSAPPVQYTRGAILPPPTLNAFGNISYASVTPYYNVSPQTWLSVWQPFLQELVAANSRSTATLSSTGASVTSSNTGAAILAPNGNIYYSVVGSSISYYNPNTNAVNSIALGQSIDSPSAVLGADGNMYMYPTNANTGQNIIKITTSTNTASTISAGTNGWWGMILAPNGNIYGIPARTMTNVLVLNTTTGTTTTITGTTNGYWGGVLAPNGRIYCIPGPSVAIINPEAGTITPNAVSGGGQGNGYFGGVLGWDGNI
jgi:hypothetical protein